jgi:ABC-type phosphonate transport system ATPase subunit
MTTVRERIASYEWFITFLARRMNAANEQMTAALDYDQIAAASDEIMALSAVLHDLGVYGLVVDRAAVMRFTALRNAGAEGDIPVEPSAPVFQQVVAS